LTVPCPRLPPLPLPLPLPPSQAENEANKQKNINQQKKPSHFISTTVCA
jgi:hypothetical protein